MKKRSVLAVVSLAAGAVIAAISPPPGGDAAAAAEPAHSLGVLDGVGDLGQLVDDASGTATSTAGSVTSTVDGARTL
ncbi:hypothetical protein [uncultured Streptomyces sp.]|uniref:hypothetical protein n=1 Tax=uncultured Streptomyces sp. TaxID=174707 RepID=UPI00260BAF2A|nr:hypothetical protein [uncultured Streptomyces sp.]